MPRTLAQYHPHGYPELRLAARTFPLRYRRDADLGRLARRLEQWETARGNGGFECRNLERLPVALAFELVHVYVALRERHPAVKPDFVDFCYQHAKDTLATAMSYDVFFPALRAWAGRTGLSRVADLAEDLDWPAFGDEAMRELRREARRELRWIMRQPVDARPVSVTKIGGVQFGALFSDLDEYQKLYDFWQRRNETAIRNGNPPRVLDTATSAAAHTLIHEFGHLVETVLCGGHESGPQLVYAALSEALLGVERPRANQWRNNLLNYPAMLDEYAGPYQGGRTRQRATKVALRATIREALGRYATTNRDELFAESFALAYGAASPHLRRRLTPLRLALVEAGVARTRVR